MSESRWWRRTWRGPSWAQCVITRLRTWLCAVQLCPVWPRCYRLWSSQLSGTFSPSTLSVTSWCTGGRSDRRYKWLLTPLLVAGVSKWKEQTCKTCCYSFSSFVCFAACNLVSRWSQDWSHATHDTLWQHCFLTYLLLLYWPLPKYTSRTH